MIGCLRIRVSKQPIIALYFETETVRKFYNLEAWPDGEVCKKLSYCKCQETFVFRILKELIVFDYLASLVKMNR